MLGCPQELTHPGPARQAATRFRLLAGTVLFMTANLSAVAQVPTDRIAIDETAPGVSVRTTGNRATVDKLKIEPCFADLDCQRMDDGWAGLAIVTLESEASGGLGEVTHYRAGEDPGLSGAEWMPYAPRLRFDLTPGVGTRTVYFQVRAKEARVSLKGSRDTLPQPLSRRDQVRRDQVGIPGAVDGDKLRDSVIRRDVNEGYVVSDIVSARYDLRRTITVASIGDSYAAGEGAPNFIGNPTRLDAWESEQCHRSGKNGRALAVSWLRQEYEGYPLDLEFKDVACSGATINIGLLGPYAGVPHGGSIGDAIPAQLDQVEEWIEKEAIARLDVLLIGIGGNDIGFSSLVATCIDPTKVRGCHRDDQLAEEMENGSPTNRTELIGFRNLPAAFDRLAERIRSIDPRHVVILQVPDPTRDEDGEFCGCRWGASSCFDDGFKIKPEHTTWGNIVPAGAPAPWFLPDLRLGGSAANLWADETQWISETIIPRLNTAIEDAARRHGWHFSEGYVATARRHGLCAAADERWFNTFFDSWIRQGDLFGSVHPNEKGYQAMSELIGESLVDVLRLDQALLRRRGPLQIIERPSRQRM